MPIQPEVVHRRTGIDIRAHLEENTCDLEMSVLRSYVEQRCANQLSEGRDYGRAMLEEGGIGPDRGRERIGIVKKHRRNKRVVQLDAGYHRGSSSPNCVRYDFQGFSETHPGNQTSRSS